MDFELSNHGSVCILVALTPEAILWADEHLPEDRMTWGPNGTVVEPRYVADIEAGIEADGLEVRT